MNTLNSIEAMPFRNPFSMSYWVSHILYCILCCASNPFTWLQQNVQKALFARRFCYNFHSDSVPIDLSNKFLLHLIDSDLNLERICLRLLHNTILLNENRKVLFGSSTTATDDDDDAAIMAAAIPIAVQFISLYSIFSLFILFYSIHIHFICRINLIERPANELLECNLHHTVSNRIAFDCR